MGAGARRVSPGRAAVAAWQETCPAGPVPGAEHGWALAQRVGTQRCCCVGGTQTSSCPRRGRDGQEEGARAEARDVLHEAGDTVVPAAHGQGLGIPSPGCSK